MWPQLRPHQRTLASTFRSGRSNPLWMVRAQLARLIGRLETYVVPSPQATPSQSLPLGRASRRPLLLLSSNPEPCTNTNSSSHANPSSSTHLSSTPPFNRISVTTFDVQTTIAIQVVSVCHSTLSSPVQTCQASYRSSFSHPSLCCSSCSSCSCPHCSSWFFSFPHLSSSPPIS